MEEIRIGSCSFTATGWETAFYPPRLKKTDYLGYYATQFDTLEVDSTFYGAPRKATAERWYRVTPPDFLFALKAPQIITHEKRLLDVNVELAEFLANIEPLAEKLGAVLFQFPYFSREAFEDSASFVSRLRPFLQSLPADLPRAIEIRNSAWLHPRLSDCLNQTRTALALVDLPRMPRPADWLDTVAALPEVPLDYIRLIGDRHAIEQQTRVWDKTVVDRNAELADWAKVIRRMGGGGRRRFVYVNNHYAGHAPATVRTLRELLAENRTDSRDPPGKP